MSIKAGRVIIFQFKVVSISSSFIVVLDSTDYGVTKNRAAEICDP